MAAAQSPYRIYVRQPPDLTKLIICGNWLETDVTLQKTTSFTVDASNCGEGALEVHVIHDGSKTEIPVKLIKNNNNVYTVDVTPLKAGKYTTNLIYGGVPVPFTKHVYVGSNIDISKVMVQGVKTSKQYTRIYSARIHTDFIKHGICIKV